MQSRWQDAPRPGLEQLAYVSRLLGADPDLVLHGGGNTSQKVSGEDAFGRPVALIHVKPSGRDMATIRADEFTALRLDDLLPLRQRDAVDDEAMVEFVRCAKADPNAPRPSIETLLHAFLDDEWVLHSHADALLAVINHDSGEARLTEIFGDDLAVVAYRRPGAQLALDVAAARQAHPQAKGIVLMHHGLVTFADDARTAYEDHIAIVTLCEQAMPLPEQEPATERDRARALKLAPEIRGATGGILHFDDSDEVRAFVNDGSLVEAAQRGPATADNIIRTGTTPCVGEPFQKDARVFLIPGVGMWSVGRNVEEATMARDIERHTMRMIRRAGSGWKPMGKQDQRDAEEWPQQARKLSDARGEGELEGRVAWISGAASGIGRAIAERFANEGAHLVLADVNAIESFGPRCICQECDVSDAAQVDASFERAVLGFGGIDIVVSNAGIAKPALVEELDLKDWERSFAVNATGHFLVARAAMRVLRAQGRGGSIVFNASKNVLAPGKGLAAYSAAKAAEAQLAKVLALEAAEFGVRVNTLHPDAVFRGTRLWSDQLREERARVHGVAVEEIEEFYAGRNLLGVAVRPEDVAEAALFFASDRSSRTTGACLTIDGGVPAAFPR